MIARDEPKIKQVHKLHLRRQGAHHEVLRLDVSVHLARIVQRLDRQGHLPRQAQRARPLQALILADDLIERLTINKVHDHPDRARAQLQDLIQRDDMRVIEP